MSEVGGLLATVVTALGVLAGLLVLAATGRGLLALRVALELWTAAGVLRLLGSPDWHAVVVAAVVLALRQLIAFAQRHPAAAASRTAGRRGHGRRRRRVDWHGLVAPAWARPPGRATPRSGR